MSLTAVVRERLIHFHIDPDASVAVGDGTVLDQRIGDHPADMNGAVAPDHMPPDNLITAGRNIAIPQFLFSESRPEPFCRLFASEDLSGFIHDP